MKEEREEEMSFWQCPWFRALTRLLWAMAVDCREEGRGNSE